MKGNHHSINQSGPHPAAKLERRPRHYSEKRTKKRKNIRQQDVLKSRNNNTTRALSDAGGGRTIFHPREEH
ncbi:hypothetical protein CEXT_577461 [Caerostris extrusa]|uniref:Uncharacterized protein n=1 Tax=Caerostris extrusa TaxID=172846 RepID=A0AAV4RH51_CAEEX|nr:hypothetical protein CEXT_577461 [Caerostris extrusa]